jgi:hypothetical protein
MDEFQDTRYSTTSGALPRDALPHPSEALSASDEALLERSKATKLISKHWYSARMRKRTYEEVAQLSRMERSDWIRLALNGDAKRILHREFQMDEPLTAWMISLLGSMPTSSRSQRQSTRRSSISPPIRLEEVRITNG